MQQVLQFEPDWRVRYESAAQDWFEKQPPGARFIGEQLRIAVKATGIENPHHPNCWGASAGAALRGWARAGCLQVCGYRNSGVKENHAHVYREYVKL